MDDQIKTIKEISWYLWHGSDKKYWHSSMYGSSYVKLLTKSGEIKQFLSVAPLLPTGIHMTSDNNIMLGAMEKVF